jgi:hypothetical protein
MTEIEEKFVSDMIREEGLEEFLYRFNISSEEVFETLYLHGMIDTELLKEMSGSG